VFVDNKFLSLVGQSEARKLVGQPLDTIIQVAHEMISSLMQDIARAGYVHERPLVVTRGNGEQIETLCTGVASYDDRKSFIGADLTLRDPGQVSPRQIATHHDVLGARILQIEAEADTQAAQDEILGQLYFTALITTVEVLLGRMGGPRIQETLENIVNQGADLGRWPIQIKGGHFVISTSGVPPEAYHILLQGVVDYGRNIVGARLLSWEMRALDDQMKPETRDIAAAMGLRDWLD
jgi:hypothetical protein